MNKEQILALLVAKFQGVRKDGLSQLARILALQSATEDEAKAAVDKLTDAQVNEFVKDFRADVDKEVSEANNTYKSNLEKKYDLVEKKVEPTITEPGGDMSKAIADAVAAALQPLKDELAGFRAGEVGKTRLQSVNDKLATCKNDGFKEQTLKMYGRMSFKDDNDFNEYLAELDKDISKANQDAANAALVGGGSPLFANKENETGVSSAVAAFVKSQEPESNQFGGKAL